MRPTVQMVCCHAQFPTSNFLVLIFSFWDIYLQINVLHCEYSQHYGKLLLRP